MLSSQWTFFDFTSKCNPNFFSIVLKVIYFQARVSIVTDKWEVDRKVLHGGKIGYGDSYLDSVFY